MRSITKLVALLPVVVALAGCVTTAQNVNGPNNISSGGDITAGDMAKMIAGDRQMIAAGLAPPELAQYDMQIARLVPEGQDILARQDKVRARTWLAKMKAVVTARNQAVNRFAAKAMARNNAIAATFGGGTPNPCLSPMGKNICAAPEPEPQRMCTIGGQGTVGLAPC